MSRFQICSRPDKKGMVSDSREETIAYWNNKFNRSCLSAAIDVLRVTQYPKGHVCCEDFGWNREIVKSFEFYTAGFCMSSGKVDYVETIEILRWYPDKLLVDRYKNTYERKSTADLIFRKMIYDEIKMRISSGEYRNEIVYFNTVEDLYDLYDSLMNIIDLTTYSKIDKFGLASYQHKRNLEWYKDSIDDIKKDIETMTKEEVASISNIANFYGGYPDKRLKYAHVKRIMETSW